MGRPFGTTVYSVNQEYFSIPSVRNSYWAGFLAADGTICSDREAIRLNISSKDKKHLEQFKKDICFSGPINKSNDLVVLTIHSVQIKSDLNKLYNITSRKSLTLEPPNDLSYSDKLAFIAGYIDGDGWKTFSRETPCIGFQGTKSVLTWICDFINDQIPPVRRKLNHLNAMIVIVGKLRSMEIELVV